MSIGLVFKTTYNETCEICEKIGKAIYNWMERVGTARAAAELSRQGYHEQAKNLILEKFK